MVKSQFTKYFNKKVFFSYPHTLTIRLKRPVYRGFGGEGRCEGKIAQIAITQKKAMMSLPNTNRTNNTNLFRLLDQYIR